jgi:hypothetical protein
VSGGLSNGCSFCVVARCGATGAKVEGWRGTYYGLYPRSTRALRWTICGAHKRGLTVFYAQDDGFYVAEVARSEEANTGWLLDLSMCGYRLVNESTALTAALWDVITRKQPAVPRGPTNQTSPGDLNDRLVATAS